MQSSSHTEEPDYMADGKALTQDLNLIPSGLCNNLFFPQM